MTHQERLESCKECSNKSFDPNRGIVCGLTDNYPTFEGTCISFNVKPTTKGFTGFSQHRTDTQLEAVSSGMRFVHWIIDRIAIYGFGYVVGTFAGLTGIGLEFLLTHQSRLDQILIGMVLSFVYYAAFELSTGRTLAKFITRTVVVNSDGSKPSYSTLIKRTFCRFIPFNHFSFLANHVGWHDSISGTLVVKKDSLPEEADENILDNF